MDPQLGDHPRTLLPSLRVSRQDQVRSWTGWHRFITLAMLALAVLTILAATAQQPDDKPQLIALTVAEIRRLLNTLVLATPLPPEHIPPIWRRTSQARARQSHYQRRQAE